MQNFYIGDASKWCDGFPSWATAYSRSDASAGQFAEPGDKGRVPKSPLSSQCRSNFFILFSGVAFLKAGPVDGLSVKRRVAAGPVIDMLLQPCGFVAGASGVRAGR